ncbi:MAG: 30S ribosomal protein S12 methylthiotransferase RimO [Candidatus Krumholzibacteriaceae bacterium]|jgi:ribosomal protein S12 methylthiotransferase
MKADAPVRRGTYSFFNLGCPKNLVDAERVAASLEEAGWRSAAAPAEAELLVVTTCAFIAQAMEESVEEILRVGAAKRPGQILAVLGCLVSREASSLEKLLPEVDVFCDVGEMGALAEKVAAGSPGRRGAAASKAGRPEARVARSPSGRRLFTPPHIAYLKIAEGCSNRCSYCMIPSIRGDIVSRPKREILAEAGELAAAGVRELVVVAQDTTAWGLERDWNENLYDLLEALADGARFDWVRLMYLHPAHADAGRLVSLIKGGAICPYLDIPIQHVSDAILERMARPYRKRDLEALFETLRSSVDDLVLRTTVMTGFPGETKAHFDELVDFLEEVSFDHVGVFAYSPERGTRAAALSRRVSRRVAQSRADELLDVQMDISQERLRARLGEELAVLVDAELAPDERPHRNVASVGRFYGQAYEIDGVTYLKGNAGSPGRFVRARIIEAQAYDLIAEPSHL